MGGELNGDKRDFDTLRLDRGGLSGAGNIQKPRAEADDLLPLAGRAAEIVPARDAVFSAGSSDGGSGCACKYHTNHAGGGSNAACGFECADGASAVNTRRSVHHTDADSGTAGTDGEATAGAGCEARSARCAGAGKTYGKAFDRCADFENRLVQRQRTARSLAVWYMADVYDSAPQKPEIPWKAWKDKHLRLKAHQIAVFSRTDSGSLPDGRRAEERYD